MSKNNTSVTTYPTYKAYVAAQKGYGFYPLPQEQWEALWSPESDARRMRSGYDVLDAAEEYIRATMAHGDTQNRALDLLDIARGEL